MPVLAPVDHARSATKSNDVADVDIVIAIFNAETYVQRCLQSVLAHCDDLNVRLILVDDCSAVDLACWLDQLCASRNDCLLLRNSVNRGYTTSINTGLAATRAPRVIILNSDTIVTRGWLIAMLRCMASGPTVGIVGPLSNAGGWQNIPRLLDDDGSFAVNVLPDGMTPDEMASMVVSASTRSYPRVPAVNGFCMMISRQVIDRIGMMDEEAFPVGYGEETDYCLRATTHGFEMAIADDAYVFHAKSKSFGHPRRQALSATGDATLRQKHTSARIERLVRQLGDTAALPRIRAAVQSKLDPGTPAAMVRHYGFDSVLFLLPVGAGGGGAHSVVQEVVAMRALGIAAKIAVINVNKPVFLEIYGDEPDVDALFVGYNSDEHFVFVASGYRVVVATIYSSVRMVKMACSAYPYILPAYYVQDYEPFFFEPGSADREIAQASYTLMRNAVLFAKTWWIADEVAQRHGAKVHKVLPSIDHRVYRLGEKHRRGNIRIAAMIRPESPRRGAARTMRVLARIAEQFRGRCLIHIFGCDATDTAFLSLSRQFAHHNHGILSRHQVAQLLGQCDIFVDLSDYQAFGRTALEAMACGCAAVVPQRGGTAEYAIDDVNSIVIDSLAEEQCVSAIGSLIADPARLRVMQTKARQASLSFSAESAAMSELTLFSAEMEKMHLPAKTLFTRVRCTLRAWLKSRPKLMS